MDFGGAHSLVGDQWAKRIFSDAGLAPLDVVLNEKYMYSLIPLQIS